jgi:hypothetical protein
MYSDQLTIAIVIVSNAAVAVLIWNGIKTVLPLRRLINARELRLWTKKKKELSDGFLKVATADGQPAEQRALLGQPTPKLLGVLQTAAISILEARKDESLIRMLSGTELPEKPTDKAPSPEALADLTKWLQPTTPPIPPSTQTGVSPPTSPQTSPEALEARDRLEARIDRRLDALQAMLEYQWMNINKALAPMVAALVASLSFVSTHLDLPWFVSTLHIIAVALVAAVFSAMVENIVAKRSAA